MPCFKGLAVSIHTADGPIPEYSIQKQTRQSRISTYIPVPIPKLNSQTGEPELSKFSVSITLLTPGQPVPYSRPAPTPSDPDPQPKIVGSLPGYGGERGKYIGSISPYAPMTSSANETVAAYIYFDGRTKEEVATLLRKSEETWVNSRWVSVPESEGGGLAERDFLFREVGLERWLNGLDLQGPEQGVKQKIIERRKRRLERHRRKRAIDPDSLDSSLRRASESGVLRYGTDKQMPLENLSADEDMSDTDSDDEPPVPEAAGQIKIALFRVMASGEIKRGEYSPQFGAHDDEEVQGGEGNGDADVDHTTSFAKPKTLDPASISTQTVTGIDPPNKPYATFTFFYRGQKQLQKMGILRNPEKAAATSPDEKRKSAQLDFSTLAPLKANAQGTVGFSSYRDANTASNSKKKRDKDRDMDSDEDDDDEEIAEGKDEENEKEEDIERRRSDLSEEELKQRGSLADGVKKIQLKRRLSNDAASVSDGTPSESVAGAEPSQSLLEQSSQSAALSTSAPSSVPPHLGGPNGAPAGLGSPFKKQRASVSGTDDLKRSLFSAPSNADASNNVQPDVASSFGSLDSTVAANGIESNGVKLPAETSTNGPSKAFAAVDEDEEL